MSRPGSTTYQRSVRILRLFVAFVLLLSCTQLALDAIAEAVIRGHGVGAGYVQADHWWVGNGGCQLNDVTLKQISLAMWWLAPQDVDLSCSQVTDEGLEVFRTHTQIRRLDLHDMQIGDSGIACFRRCRRLRHLYVSGTQITLDGVASLEGAAKIMRLDLVGTSSAISSYHRFAELKSLSYVTIDASYLHPDTMQMLRNCHSLHIVSIDDESASDSDVLLLSQLKGLGTLEVIEIYSPRVTDECIKTLQKELPTVSIFLRTGR